MCEWNPKYGTEATEPPSDGDCPNPATHSCGKYHLCVSCMALARFKRFKKTELKSADTDGWSSECPTTEGKYYLRCEETGMDDSKAVIYIHGIRELWADVEGELRPLRMWHNGLTNPQWRPAKAVSETPETDAAHEVRDDETSIQHIARRRKVMESLETRLADAERAQYQAEKAMVEIESECMRWKAVAETLGVALTELEWTSCGCDKCKAITQGVAELERIKGK